MNYFKVLSLALVALPLAFSANARCNIRDSNSNWTYYSVATGNSPYTISCGLTVANGAITAGQCTSSDGTSFTATGTLTVASSNGGGGPKGSRSAAVTRAFVKKNPTICTVSGAITYPDIGLTETLTNMTLNHERDMIVGVGTNDTDLISVTFVSNR